MFGRALGGAKHVLRSCLWVALQDTTNCGVVGRGSHDTANIC